MSHSRKSIRAFEKRSITKFIEANRGLFNGRTLDFGCGLSPYQEFVAGEYVPYDIGLPPHQGTFDAILCTQVLEYIKEPRMLMDSFYEWLNPGGSLVMTYPTHWEEVDKDDFWRFTKAGMEHLVAMAGFIVDKHELRFSIPFDDFSLAVGYGIVCHRPGK